jgi:pimeloyl-ACP methyl ester carboxylesterase
LIANVDRVVAMALRLAEADEPESVAAVVQRVVAPITVIVGGVKTQAGPSQTEFLALGPRARFDTIRGAGHFPHEESPDEVLARIRPVVVAVALPPL